MRSLVLTAGDDSCPDNLLTELIDALCGLAKLGSTAGKFFDGERQADAHVR